MTASSEALESKKAGVFDDFVDIITSPSRVFERRQDGKFGTHLLLLTLICVVLFFVFKNAMEPIFDAEFSRNAAKMMEKNNQRDACWCCAVGDWKSIWCGANSKAVAVHCHDLTG
ncbi:MAG: hypothetical protein H0W69_05260, partial [Gemmatimonadaceae bacterium]|nr:hypothetical protein [Gemmatimonadaceae bacterium]